jgi:hypothetical protein
MDKATALQLDFTTTSVSSLKTNKGFSNEAPNYTLPFFRHSAFGIDYFRG